MAADNIILNSGTGGSTVRTYSDGTLEHPAGILEYITGGSAGAWTFQAVDASHGLPVAGVGNFAITAAALPLPTGAATSANQVTELASLASIDSKTAALIGGNVPVTIAGQTGTVTVQFGVAQHVIIDSATLGTVTVTGAVAVTNAGTFAVQLSASLPAGTNVIGHVVVDSGAVNATLAAETTKVIGTVNISASQTVGLVAGVAEIGNVKNSGTFAVQATLAAETVKVIGTINVAAGQTIALAAGSAVIGHVVVDSGAIALSAGVAEIGNVKNSGTFAVQSTLAAETTKVIGTVNVAAAQTIAVTNAGTFAVQATLAAETTKVIGTVNIAAAQTLATVTTVSAVTAITNALPAGTNLLGKVGIDQTTPGTTNGVQSLPGTSGGLSSYSFLSTAAVQTQAVKASPGQVYSMEFFNNGAAAVYVRLYNQTGAPASTDGANIIWRGLVPGNTAGAGFVKSWEKGLKFTTGIGVRVTGAVADNDTTVLAANGILGNVEFV